MKSALGDTLKIVVAVESERRFNAAADTSDPGSPSPGDTISPSESQKTADGQGLRNKLWIVLVEDNPGDVRLIREAFYECELDYNLTVLSDGEKAVNLLDRIQHEAIACPDLLVLDIGLPRKGGFEVLERVRASKLCAHMPVVILTSSKAQKDRDMAAKLGATRYLQKPDRLEKYIKLGVVFRDLLTVPGGAGGDG